MSLLSKNKSSSNTAEKRMEKAMLAVVGGGIILTCSVIGTAGLGAYLAYTAVGSSVTGVLAGAGGLCVGAVLGLPVGGTLIAAGGVALGICKMTLKAAGAVIGLAARPFTKNKQKPNAQKKPHMPVISGVQSRAGVKPQSVKTSFNGNDNTAPAAQPTQKQASKPKSAPKP